MKKKADDKISLRRGTDTSTASLCYHNIYGDWGLNVSTYSTYSTYKCRDSMLMALVGAGCKHLLKQHLIAKLRAFHGNNK